jgi:hypothetical protein
MVVVFSVLPKHVRLIGRSLDTALQEVLENQSEYFVLLASQFATMHDRIQTLKQEFIQYRQDRGLNDPFEEHAGEDSTKKKSMFR